jgi:DNA ligase-1
MRHFAYVANAAAAHSAKLEKITLIAEYFTTLDDADLAAAARFFTGNPFAASDSRSLGIGGRSLVAVAKRVWGFDDAALSAHYRDSGDLGAALGPLVRPATDLQLFAAPPLTPARLAAAFAAIADASGKHAGKRRDAILEEILRACTDPMEAAYVVKIITGDLRIGLREGLVHDAIAKAFDVAPADVRRAVMSSGDAGEVAIAARHHRLDEIRVAYGTPVGFMLASPLAFGDAYDDLANARWITEEKYDGIRAQAHVDGGSARLFSRTLNDITHSYPEVADALARVNGRVILDGEIIASRDGKPLPFRTLQARLQRKEIDPALLADVPLTYVVFDLLAVDDDFLIDVPLIDRRARLAEVLVATERIAIAPFAPLESAADVNDRYERARQAGHEGLMLKRTDAPYAPGRRGKLWLKLKRELSTLDVVVIAVEWGHGKRAKVLSDYTFAVRGDDGELLTIGKAYSGLTDAEIAQLTPWFLEHRLPDDRQRERARSHEIPVEPAIVLEVAFDIVQKSDLHESGYSLRFPRIVRIRDDKPAAEIDTLERVDEIYRQMLARESSSTIADQRQECD